MDGLNTRRTPALVIVRLIAGVFIFACGVAQALKADADRPLHIRAKNVDANEKTGVSVYRGNVVAIQGSFRLEAERLEVTMRDGQVDRLRAWGQPVRVRSCSDKGEELRGRAQRAEYDGAKRRIDLYRDVELSRDADVVSGNVLHYSLDDETFSAEGDAGDQVTAVVQPKKPPPAAGAPPPASPCRSETPR
jgi:lipopolysaccharide export system protein LptA